MGIIKKASRKVKVQAATAVLVAVITAGLPLFGVEMPDGVIKDLSEGLAKAGVFLVVAAGYVFKNKAADIEEMELKD